VLFAASMVGQLSLEAIPARTALPLGSAIMVLGSALIAVALAASSLALLVAGAVVAGLGVGMAFRSGLALVNDASPSSERAAVASSFFVVSYVAISLPIVGIGIAAEATNLRDAGIAFSGLIGVLALAVMASLARRATAARSPATS
jgi:MFS family permease